jgi:hypothetical protein
MAPQNKDLQPERATRLTQLLDLAYNASSYLRHSPSRAVRVSAALLLAASLAACSGNSDQDLLSATGGKSGAVEQVSKAQPLAREVRAGLPDKPGNYLIQAGSVSRDQQGVYSFNWRGADEAENAAHRASVSQMKLLESDVNSLEIPAQGDPVLHLRKDTPIELAAAGTAGGSNSTTVINTGPSMPWFPFFLMTRSFSPIYYDPPPIVQSGTPVQGSRTSVTAPAPSDRAIGVKNAVSGKAGGAGAGTAVTNRVGGSTSGGSSGVSASSSSSFSAGKSGGSVSSGG